jgi:hypothetical protein
MSRDSHRRPFRLLGARTVRGGWQEPPARRGWRCGSTLGVRLALHLQSAPVSPLIVSML